MAGFSNIASHQEDEICHLPLLLSTTYGLLIIIFFFLRFDSAFVKRTMNDSRLESLLNGLFLTRTDPGVRSISIAGLSLSCPVLVPVVIKQLVVRPT